jgi:hypothetical protein
VIAPVEVLPSIEAQLAGVPHASLFAGDPGTVSRSYVLLVNQAELVATGRTEREPDAGAVRAAGVPRAMRPNPVSHTVPQAAAQPLQSRVRGL